MNPDASKWLFEIVGKVGAPFFLVFIMLYGFYSLGELAIVRLGEPMVAAWIKSHEDITSNEISTRLQEGAAALEIAQAARDVSVSVQAMNASMLEIRSIHSNVRPKGDQ